MRGRHLFSAVASAVTVLGVLAGGLAAQEGGMEVTTSRRVVT